MLKKKRCNHEAIPVVLWVKPVFLMTASHIRVLVWVQATLLPIWLPANLSGRSEEGGLITCIPTACAGELDESLDPGFSFAWSWLLQFLFQQMENLSLLSLSSCTSAFQINKYFLKRKNHDSVFVRLISIDSFYHCLTYPTLQINVLLYDHGLRMNITIAQPYQERLSCLTRVWSEKLNETVIWPREGSLSLSLAASQHLMQWLSSRDRLFL